MLNSIIHICEFNTYFHMYHVLCSVTQLFPTLCDPMDCNPQGTSLHRLSRQEYWSGLPFPTSAHFPDPGIKPRYLASPALAGRFLTTMPCGELKKYTCGFKYILTYVLRVHMYIYILESELEMHIYVLCGCIWSWVRIKPMHVVILISYIDTMPDSKKNP